MARLLATGSYDNTIKLWNVETVKEFETWMATMERCLISLSSRWQGSGQVPAATER